MRGFLEEFSPERLGGKILLRRREEGLAPTRILCLGKAAPALARAVASVWSGRPGLVYGTSEEPVPKGFQTLWGDHPLSTRLNLENTRRLRAWLEAGSGPLLACVSGGGSALLVEPSPPWTLREKADAISVLLDAGAPIRDVNVVRARLSRVKAGGLLASVSQWPVVTAVWSDVGPRDARLVSSGPTLPWRSGVTADSVLKRYGIDVPRSLPEAVQSPKRSEDSWFVLCDALSVRKAVAGRLRASGYNAREVAVGEGESAEALAERVVRTFSKSRSRHPLALVGVGEATVKAAPGGRGGRCSHLTAAVALAMSNAKCGKHWAFTALATDGVDGTGGSGAFVDSRALPLAAHLSRALKASNTAVLWEQAGTLLPARPTGNNLRDVWALVQGGSR